MPPSVQPPVLRHTLEIPEALQRQLLALNQNAVNARSAHEYTNARAALYEALLAQWAAQPGLAEKLAAQAGGHCALYLWHPKPAMRNLPWHLVLDGAQRQRVHLMRSPEANGPAGTQAPLPCERVRVLVAIASPDGAAHRLDFEEEEEKIIEAFGPLLDAGVLELDFVDDGSLPALQQALFAKRYQVLYFSGHGAYEVGRGGGLLFEAEESMAPVFHTGAEIAGALTERPGFLPELVFLNACQSGKGTQNDTMGGDSVAEALLKAGVPAVLAMADSVGDAHATVYAGLFFEKWLLDAKNRKPLPVPLGLPQAFGEALHVAEPRLLGQSLLPVLYGRTALWELLHYEGNDNRPSARTRPNEVRLFDREENYVFVGRRRERKFLLNQLLTHRKAMVTGQGGLGKSTIAEHLAGRLQLALHSQQAKPLAVLMLGEADFQAIGPAILQKLEAEVKEKNNLDYRLVQKELEAASFGDAFKLLMDLLTETHEVLWVLDNLESLQEGPGDTPIAMENPDFLRFLKALRPYSKQTYLLCTGRYPIEDLQVPQPMALKEVRFADFWKKSGQMPLPAFLQPTGDHTTDRTAQSARKELLKLFYQKIGGNYLALKFFVGACHTLPPSDAHDLLNQLEPLTDKVAQEMALNLAFDKLQQAAGTEAMQALHLLAQFRIPVLPLALEMQGMDKTEPLSERLTQLTLLDQSESKGFTFYAVPPLINTLLQQGQPTHPPTLMARQAGKYHEYADQNIGDKNYSDLHEALTFYLIDSEPAALQRVAGRYCRGLYEKTDFNTLLDILQKVEARVGHDQLNGDIANRMGMILLGMGEGEKALPYFERNLVVEQADGDKKGEGATLNNIGQIYSAKGEYDTAFEFLLKSLDIQQAIGDIKGEGTTLNNISTIFHAKGDYDTALEYLLKSLNILKAIGYKKEEGTTLNNISTIFHAKGDYDNALKYLLKTLNIQQAIGDKSGEGAALNNISAIYSAKGDHDTALEFLLKSLNIQQTIGDKSGEGGSLNNISQIYHAKGEYDTALEFLLKSLNIQQTIGDKSGEGTSLNNISSIYQAKGEYDTALEYLLKSLNIQQAIGEKSGEGTTLNNISQIYHAKGDYDTALEYLLKSLKIRQAIGDIKGEGTTLNNISQIFFEKGDYDTALEYLLKSLNIQQAIGDKSGEGTTLNNISQIYSAKGDYDTALKYLLKSLSIQQAISDKKGEGTTLNNISQIYHEKRDYDTAFQYLLKSLNIQQAIGDKSGEGTTLNNISQIYHAKGDYDTALQYLLKSLNIQQAIGDKAGEGATLNNISTINHAKGDYDTALEYLLKSLNIQQAIGDKLGHSYTLHNIATIYRDQKQDLEQYFKHERAAFQLAKETQNANIQIETSFGLGITLCQIGQREQGLPLLQEALQISKTTQNPLTLKLEVIIRHFSSTNKMSSDHHKPSFFTRIKKYFTR